MGRKGRCGRVTQARQFSPLHFILGVAQPGLEYLLWKEKVVGSNPISQTSKGGKVSIVKRIVSWCLRPYNRRIREDWSKQFQEYRETPEALKYANDLSKMEGWRSGDSWQYPNMPPMPKGVLPGRAIDKTPLPVSFDEATERACEEELTSFWAIGVRNFFKRIKDVLEAPANKKRNK